MLNKFTLAGIVIGSVIIAIGAYALVSSIGLQTVNLDEKIDITKSVSYQFFAPKNSQQSFKVTGEKFHVKLDTPDNTVKKDNDYKNEISFDWIMTEDGTNKIKITDRKSTRLNSSHT